MAISIGMTNPAEPELKPRITVVGVGGAGGNAVNNMIRSNLQGVDFVVSNTDSQALSHNLASIRLQLGRNLTRGLGAGAKPDVGRAAAEEAIEDILEIIDGSNMVFIAAGMGGGTGTGAAPVIARAARERGILTVGVVTKPFHFEGQHRMRLAESGIQELQQYVDTLIVIPNQNLFRLANERTTFADAFKMADDVLHSGVRGVTDLMIMPGMINLDFADIRSVMSEMGKAMMGTGEGSGERRALDAAEAAISNPLLEDTSMKGARGVLIHVTGGKDMALFEVDEAANRIREEVDPEANIIFGSTFDESLEGKMRVSVVATGIDAEAMAEPRRPQISLVSDTSKPRSIYTGMGGGGFGGGEGQVHPAAMAGAMANPGLGQGLHPTMSAAPTMSAGSQTATQANAGAPATATMETGSFQPAFDGNAALAIQPQAMETPAPAPASAPVSAPVSASVSAQPKREPFIAPPPVESGRAPTVAPGASLDAAKAVEPVKKPVIAADRGPATRDKRSPSLFEKMTNPFGRRSETPAAPTTAAPTTSAPVASTPAAPMAADRAEPQMAAKPQAAPITASVTAAAATSPATGMTAGAAPSLGLSAGPRAATGDEDMFEIPAFLRRQAN